MGNCVLFGWSSFLHLYNEKLSGPNDLDKIKNKFHFWTNTSVAVIQARVFHGDKVRRPADRPFQLSIWAKYDFEDAPDGGGALIAPNWALTAAHVVLTQTDVTLYPKVKIGGGSVYWKESMDSNFQSVEFETKNNVFVRKIMQTWNELPWSGDGKSLLATQLLVLGFIKFFR